LQDATDAQAGYLLTGVSTSLASGRLAYTFGLEGPAITVDTACSSSLVAIHLAAQALRTGECSLALAGGVTVMATPGMFVEFSRQRGLSADGRCKAFSATADGTAWSEGAGLLLLERRSDAERLGHPVLAVIAGSAINQDGASNGLTAPSGPAQERVIRQALSAARLTSSQVDVVEAHGTGTPLGDPIEAQALLATYGRDRPAGQPLLLGSLKSNIGHSQAAAGVGGIIKMVMAMHHAHLPATLHVTEPTPHVSWDTGAVTLLTSATAWPVTEHPRRSAVSSFGISGTNAHVILEHPDVDLAPAAPEAHGVQNLETEDDKTGPVSEGVPAAEAVPAAWVLSARNEAALAGQAARLRDALGNRTLTSSATLNVGATPNGSVSLNDTPADLTTNAVPQPNRHAVAHALATSRASLPYKAVVIGTTADDFHAALDQLANGSSSRSVITATPALPGKTAFLFTGQGSQHPVMGAGLYRAYPVFAEALDEAFAELDPHLPQSLRHVMFTDDTGLINNTLYTQPALLAYEIALYRLLLSTGLIPDYLVGHSIGEITAAHASGVLNLSDAATLVTTRARLMAALPLTGAMIAVNAPAAEVEAALPEGARLSIAAINGPASTVISGDVDAARAVAAHFDGLGIRTRQLTTSHAFHSPLMDPMLDEFRATAARLSYQPPSIPIISNLTGRPAGAEIGTADYWTAHVSGTVRYHQAVTYLQDQTPTTLYLEVGPDAHLSPHTPTAVPVQRRNTAESFSLLSALGQAHTRGHAITWPWADAAAAGSSSSSGSGSGSGPSIQPTPPIALPTYAFQRQHYWVPAAAKLTTPSTLGLAGTDHPLLTTAVETAGSEALLLTGRISAQQPTWIADHVILGSTLLPAAALTDLALHAGLLTGCPELSELTLEAPLALPSRGGVQLQLAVAAPDEDGARTFTVHGRSDEQTEWTRHAAGLLTAAVAEPEVLEWLPDGAEALDLDGFYDTIAETGYLYGTSFRGLNAAWRHGDDVYAELALPADVDVSGYTIHPALLDAAFQAVIIGGETELRVPFALTGVRVFATGAASARVRVTKVSDDAFALSIVDPTGGAIATVGSLRIRTISAGVLGGARDGLYQPGWTPISAGSPASTAGWVLLGAAGAGLARSWADGLGIDIVPDLESAAALLPDVVLVPWLSDSADPAAADPAAATREQSRRALTLLREWLAEERFSTARLVLLTSGAVAVEASETVTDLAGAAIWGLIRSAQSEHPGRFVIADLGGELGGEPGGEPGGSQPAQLLPSALTELSEPQLALRDDAVLVPRLSRMAATVPPGLDLDPEGTVLITGATGTLGGLIARHLVTTGSSRRLLLVSRSADQATRLSAELTGLGAEVTLAACDVADRASVARLIGSIPAEHPLTAVIHAAGVVSDGTVEALTDEQLDRVLAPKVDAAWHLHQLTRDLPLRAFVLFSSITASTGTAGQANYAAANAFLDGLARHRHDQGLAATSMAWGLWEDSSTITSQLNQADLARLARAGITPLATGTALALFDQAVAESTPMLVAAQLNLPALRAAAPETLPPVLRGLVAAAPHRPGLAVAAVATGSGPAAGSWARHLTLLAPDQQHTALLDLVRREGAAVLGHATPDAVRVDAAFTVLGFDSLGAVELRNRLTGATGLRLPAGLLFDYPTPGALAEYLRAELASAAPLLEDLNQLEAAMFATHLGDDDRARLISRFQEVLNKLNETEDDESLVSELIDDLEYATDDEIFDFIDNEFGKA
jgi:acyl transferase domain-containing protein